MLGVYCTDKACQDHVDGSGVQSGCDEDQDGLDNEAAYAFGVVVRPDPSDVAYDLDFLRANC